MALDLARTVQAALALLLLGSSPVVAAETCLDQVRRLADRHGLSTDPPTVVPEAPKPLRPDELGRSGGVIAPPPTPDQSVIAPPRGTSYGMPTVPDVTSEPKRGGSAPNSLSAADLTALQSILVAARAQAERGKESECLDRLAQAREFDRKKQP